MGDVPMDDVSITDREFQRYRKFLYEAAGIQLTDSKKPLVTSRLSRRLSALGIRSYGAYLDLIQSGRDSGERQTAIDLLTTNETYFFRESKHFDLLRDLASRAPAGKSFRVWSAACSSGEEPYSIAMVLADVRGSSPWEVFASDLSTRMLDRARAAHYPMERATHVPRKYLERFCLKGIDDQAGTLLVDAPVRGRVQFAQVNLMEPLPDLGRFDVVFLRNVLIYFDLETKRGVVGRLSQVLTEGGHLFIGHSEALHGIAEGFETVMPTVYRRAGAARVAA